MPDNETDVAFADETLTDFEFAENSERNEDLRGIEHTNPKEREDHFDTRATAARDTSLSAILEERGGRQEDWAFVDRGDAGYHFDGKNVRDPEGNIWTNPDAALHQEMLEAWREGEATVFLLPDYIERTEEKETLYITTLSVDASGQVSWEIHAHETPIAKEEVLEMRDDSDRAAETYAVAWEEIADEVSADKHEAEMQALLASAEMTVESGAEEAVEEPEEEEAEDDAPIGSMFTTYKAKLEADDKKLGSILRHLFERNPLENDLSDNESSEPKTSAPVQKERAAKKEKVTDILGQASAPETHAEDILRALGIPLPAQTKGAHSFATPLPGFKPARGKSLPQAKKLRPGEVERNGIRMRRPQ